MRKLAKAFLSLAAILCLETGQAKADLITNGSFETGDFTGWTQTGNTGFTGVSGVFGGVSPTDGNFQAFFGAVGSLGGIVQTVAPTTSGQSYQLTFDLHNFGGTPSEYKVTVDGVVAFNVVDPGSFPYTTFTYNFVASGTSTPVEFEFQQNPDYFLLDNVHLNAAAAVPEPGTLALAGMAIFGLAAYGRRRRAKVAV